MIYTITGYNQKIEDLLKRLIDILPKLKGNVDKIGGTTYFTMKIGLEYTIKSGFNDFEIIHTVFVRDDENEVSKTTTQLSYDLRSNNVCCESYVSKLHKMLRERYEDKTTTEIVDKFTEWVNDIEKYT